MRALDSWSAAIDARERALAVLYGVDLLALAELQRTRRRLTTDAVDIWQAMAVGVVAPVLAGFAHWIAAQAGRHEHPVLLGVMREGRVLGRLLTALHEIPAAEIWVNRHCAMLAAFGCGDATALVNWLARTRVQPMTRAAAEALLGTPVPGDPAAVLDAATAQILVDDNPGDWLGPVRVKAQALAARLLLHWRGIVPPDRPVLLLDFACAGNIQRALRTVLAAAGDTAPLVGLNFLMTRGSIWAERAGCVMQGFLAERGVPELSAVPYARTPELIEIFAAAPVGPLLDYGVDGTPQVGATFLTLAQQEFIGGLQARIITVAGAYHQLPDALMHAALARCVLGRLLTQPTAEEVAALADWPIDGGLDGGAARPLAPRLDPRLGNDPAVDTRAATAWPVGSRVRAESGI